MMRERWNEGTNVGRSEERIKGAKDKIRTGIRTCW